MSQNNHKKISIIFLSLLLITTVLALHNKLQPPPPKVEIETIRVLESVRSPYFLPLYLAINLGYFQEQNIEITLTSASSEAIRTALVDGRADIALSGLQKIIFNPADPNRIKACPIVFATMSNRDGSLVLSREKDDTFQWQKIKYATIIGNPHNNSSEIALESILRQNGILPYRHVTIYNNIPETLRLSAFQTGTGHYLLLPEPEASDAEMQGHGKVVAAVGAAGDEMLVTAFGALPEYLSTHQEAVQKFTNAIYKAQRWVKQHSAEEAAAVVSPSFTNVDLIILTKSIERYNRLGIWADNPVVEQAPYDKFNHAAKAAGEIPSLIPYETTVDTRFAKHALETVIIE